MAAKSTTLALGIAVLSLAATATAILTDRGNLAGDLLFCLIAFLAGLAYFAPAFIAFERGHRRDGLVLAVNALMGWLALPWVLCLVWACRKG